MVFENAFLLKLDVDPKKKTGHNPETAKKNTVHHP